MVAKKKSTKKSKKKTTKISVKKKSTRKVSKKSKPVKKSKVTKKRKKPAKIKVNQEVKEVEVITIGEELDEEEISAEDEEALIKSGKWWLQEPWRSLLDPDLAKNVEFSKFDLSKLIEDFTDRMLQEDLIDFRISGLAIYSSAKFYHQKITGVIHEEEKIQKEIVRERRRREVPKAISQPLRESRKIATSDELFGAMRRAIIETMQKREKLRIRRVKKEAKKQVTVKKRGKGKLPAEILKHITGKEETIEQRLKRTHYRIKEIIQLEGFKDENIPMKYFKDLLYKNSDSSIFEKKVAYIQRFEEMLFLASLNKVKLHQETLRSDIDILLTDKTGVSF